MCTGTQNVADVHYKLSMRFSEQSDTALQREHQRKHVKRLFSSAGGRSDDLQEMHRTAMVFISWLNCFCVGQEKASDTLATC